MLANELDTRINDALSPALTPARAQQLLRELTEVADNHDTETKRKWALARLHLVIGEAAQACTLVKAFDPRMASLRVALNGSPMGKAAVRVEVLLELVDLAHAAGLSNIVSPPQQVALHFYAGRANDMARLVRQYRSAGQPVFDKFVLEGLLVGREKELSERFGLPYDGDRGPLEAALIERAAHAVLEVLPDADALQSLASLELWSAPDAAIRHIDEAAALVPNVRDYPWGFAKSWLTQAKAHLNLGEREHAIASLRRAFDHVARMTADPGLGDLWRGRNLREEIWGDFGFQALRRDKEFLALVRPAAANKNVLALENLADPENCDSCLKKGIGFLGKDKKATKALVKVMVGAVDQVILDLKEHGDANLDDYALGSREAYVEVRKALKKVSSPPTAAQLKSLQLLLRSKATKGRKPKTPKTTPAKTKRSRS